jgi:1-acyl-sn-glycerol-3-phosphate acyltransferase
MATGFSFAVFGVGGLALRVLFFPLLGLLVRDRSRRTRVARTAVHHTFRFFVGLMRFVGVLRYRIEGVEKLARPGLLILANHPTLIDVVFLISLVPNASCVVKASLARNPFTRGPVRATGYLCNDSGPELVNECIASLEAGDNLLIFPEGTRTPVGGPMRLLRGAANIAVRGQRDMTLVTIRCEPIGLTKGTPWWKVPPKPMNFTIRVHDDLPIRDFVAHEPRESMAARALTTYLHGFFSQGHCDAGA